MVHDVTFNVSLDVLGFDCSIHPQQNECLSIQNSNLTQHEKDEVIVNLLYEGSYEANHIFIHDWNTAITALSPPQNVATTSGVYVQHVWMKLFSIIPSVKEQQALYVTDTGHIQSGYHYDLTIPTDYFSSGYPNTHQGDCKRLYILQSELESYIVNDHTGIVGMSNYFPMNFSTNTSLHAQYSISVHVDVEHYHWQNQCCSWSQGQCQQICHYCTHHNIDHTQDTIQISDSLNLTYDNRNSTINFTPINQYDNTTVGKLTTNSVNFALQSGNSSYIYYHYRYALNYDYKPYYVLQLKAKPINETITQNILIHNNHLIFKQNSNCQITLNTHFTNATTSCNQTFTPINLTITTDKIAYQPGEIINVTLTPQNTPINVTYGNISTVTTNSAHFPANKANKIIAQFDEITTERFIHIKNLKNNNVFYLLTVFSSITYTLYVLATKYWGGAFGL